MAFTRSSYFVAVAVMAAAAVGGLVSPLFPNLILLAGIMVVALLTNTGTAIAAVAVATGIGMFNGASLPVPDQVGRAILFVLIAGGVVGMVAARRARGEASEQYRVLFDNNPFPMWLYDAENLAFLNVNRTATKVYGYTRAEFLRMRVPDVHPEAERARVADHPTGGAPEYHGTWTHVTKDGHLLTVNVRANLVEWGERPARLAIIEDITERRLLEAQLQQSQKMEAIGQLAGGIAHDFNNLLTAIRGYTDLLVSNFDERDERARADLQEITQAADQAAALTRQLLAFSRKQILEVRVLKLGEVVQEIAPMLRRLVDESMDVATIMRDRGHVKADPSQLQQVLVNLVVNARDAIQSAGRITIETADVELDEAYASQHASAHPGPHVMLAVSDTGHGMDAATQARIFEPFFTTKPAGYGTGLGLSTVYGIVKQSGGHIWVYSEPGQGSTFKVYLPTTTEPVGAKVVKRSAPRPLTSQVTVLLVEDEGAVRRLVTRVLSSHGFTVHGVGSASEAIALAEKRHVTFQLLLTDVVLPEITGRAVAEAVQRAHPTCRVLFMSGYTDDAIVRHGVLEQGVAFIQKPFTSDGLIHKINEVLEGQGHTI
jgi:two-component system cell cycle sensor histidine kinase/response regulator CckA